MSIVFKKPLTFEMGLGVTGSLNGKVTGSFSMGDGKDDNNINFNIAQPVDPTASPTFNTVSASGATNKAVTIGLPHSNIVLHYHGISGSGIVYGGLHTTEGLTMGLQGNPPSPHPRADLFVGGTLSSTNLIVLHGNVTSSKIFKSGSTLFGDTNDDIHSVTGSFSMTGEQTGDDKYSTFTFNNYIIDDFSQKPWVKTIAYVTSSFREMGLAFGESSSSLVSEFTARNYLDSIHNYKHLRKNFVHTGSIQNGDTVHFTAVTASDDFRLKATDMNDFYFWVNGMLMEPDALSIQQNSSVFALSVNTSSLGYSLDVAIDEVVTMGKFNS
tara:strand:- start:80 stop:1057 length:978 start_codon:yes stop_codon:yes gene_type:complete